MQNKKRKPAPRKTTTKRAKEFEVIESDRMQLIHSARLFVATMVDKLVIPTLGSGAFTAQDLNEEETAAYNAALDFLRRQFIQGDRGPSTHKTRIESEDSREI